MIDYNFRYRIYTKGELAMLYFPTCSERLAAQRLRRWILRSPTLMKQLKEEGYDSHSHFYSSSQVRVIVNHIGEP